MNAGDADYLLDLTVGIDYVLLPWWNPNDVIFGVSSGYAYGYIAGAGALLPVSCGGPYGSTITGGNPVRLILVSTHQSGDLKNWVPLQFQSRRTRLKP